MNELLILAGALALAVLIESMTEYIFGTVADHVPALVPYKWLLMYVAAAWGVGVCIYYQVDLISLIFQQEPTVVGVVMTGLAVGRGSNYLHQFISKFFPGKPIPVG